MLNLDSKPVSTDPVAPPGNGGRQIDLTTGLTLALVLLAWLVFFQAVHFHFVEFDDPDYVTRNPHILEGLTWDTLRWAFTTTHAANWHPVTWISLAIDRTLFGPGPAGFHAVNITLHSVNTALLFRLLQGTTRATWPSALVAALFAIHPLHVESVVWVSERKDVLSLLFGLLTIRSYLRWVSSPSWRSYAAMLGWFCGGLLAKPMLVSLPLLLLLLDVWPLKRIHLGALSLHELVPRVREKGPLIALSALSCVITYFAQQGLGAVARLEVLPVASRLGNAAISTVEYLRLFLWPTGLSCFYPLILDQIKPGLVIASVSLIITATLLVLRFSRSFPFLFVGWFWYVFSLVPVIGIVQVGGQRMADRYTYIPLIGIFIIVAWGLASASEHWRLPRWVIPSACSLGIAIFSVASFRQAGYWKDTITLFERAVRVTDRNWLAYERLADSYFDAGRYVDSIKASTKAARIASFRSVNFLRIGDAWRMLGDPQKALVAYGGALSINPMDLRPEFMIGCVLSEGETPLQSIPHFERVLASLPGQLGNNPEFILKAFSHARFTLGLLYRKEGRLPDSSRMFSELIQTAPDQVSPYVNLGINLLSSNRHAEAVSLLNRAAQARPNDLVILLLLARGHLGAGDTTRADEVLQRILAMDSANREALSMLKGVIPPLEVPNEQIQPFKPSGSP